MKSNKVKSINMSYIPPLHIKQNTNQFGLGWDWELNWSAEQRGTE